MTSFGIGIVVNKRGKDVRQSAMLNPRMMRWYAVLIPLLDRAIIYMIVDDERKDMVPVTVGMIIPALVKKIVFGMF